MIKSVNQIRLELAEIQATHLQLNSFFWGDFLRAYKENRLNYPLMGAFYPTSTLLRNQTQLQLRIYIADKLYKDWSNLNDIESDTLQTCRDIFNTMNNSTRWQAIGRVQSCSVTKFINRGGDEVAGHEMTMNFLIRDRDGVCGLPMGSYDFDQVTGSLCSPVQIYEDGVLIDTVPSGGIYNVVGSPATQVITDSLGNQLYSNSIPSGVTETQVIQDSSYTVEYINGTLIESGSILAEGSVTVQVPNPITCADATVNVNGVLFDTVASGDTLDIEVRQEQGATLVGSKQGQYWRVDDSPVNINGGLITNVPAEDTLSINVTLNGSNSGTWNSGTQTWEVVSAAASVGATLMKTGQTTSYRTGDDGDIEAGRDVDFFTLASNNPFGNTNRFTDELGGSTYTNNWVIDWSTFDGATVLGYYRSLGASVNWNNAIDNSLGTFGGFSGCRLANTKECFNIMNYGAASYLALLNYSPFNIISTLWLSNSLMGVSSYAYYFSGSTINVDDKAGTGSKALTVRTFTVTGTTLT